MFVKPKQKLTRSLLSRWVPRKYQAESVSICLKRLYVALFLDPGLGKTSIILQVFNKLKIRKQAKGLLVIAPINPCYMTWPDEIKGWTNFRRFSYVILHGKNKDADFKKGADIYIINPEGLPWLVKTMKGKHRINWPFDVLAVDESYKFKNPTSNRTKALQKFIGGFKARFILNGTPTGNGYINLMSQIRIVDQGQSLGTKITHYRDKYFDQVGKPEWRQYNLKHNADKHIMKKIAPFTICLKAEDHVDMPSLVSVPRFIHLPNKAQQAYNDIEKELFTILDDKELVAESAVSVSNKLHQLCNGSIYEDQDPLGEPLPSHKRGVIEVHKEKLYALDDLIEECAGSPIIVAYKFKHDKKALQKHFKNRIKFFDEAKTGKAKQKIQDNWNKNVIPLLAGNTESISHGLNLQKGGANHIAFYSINHDYESYDQFIRRLRRSGNSASQIFAYHFLAKGLYDHEVIYSSLKNRGKTHKDFFKWLISYRHKRQNKCNK